MEFTGERFFPSPALLRDEIAYEHLHRYHAVLDCVEDKVVLDIACGEGYGTALLATRARKVYGVDIDAACIELAANNYAADKSNIAFSIGNVTEIPLPEGSIDIVISFETVEHLDQKAQEAFLLQVRKVLRKDGQLIISTPDKKQYSERYHYTNPFHVNEFTKDEFLNFLGKHFSNVMAFSQGYEVISAITEDRSANIGTLKVLDWQTADRHFERKFLIAVCSHEPLRSRPPLTSAVFGVSAKYLELTDRIAGLEARVSELGVWGKNLDQVIAERDATIRALQAENAAVVSQLSVVQSEKNAILERAGKQSADERNLIQEQKQKIHQLYQEVEKLNGRLREIYDSEGWKLLQVYYNLKGRLLPEHSKRYKKLKRIFNSIRGKRETYEVPASPAINKWDAMRHRNRQHRVAMTFKPFELPHFDAPYVSIVLPVYNEWELTYNCLSSIKEHTLGIAYEVIVADDASTDDTTSIKQVVRNVVVVRNDTNTGFLQNCNHAAAQAKGKYIVFLNNDTEVRPGWLTALADLMEKDATIGMAGSKLIYPDGRLQEAGAIVWKDASAWNYGHRQDPEAAAFNYVKEVDYVSGASIMIRSALWKDIGGFDNRYAPAYSEDSDLAFEVRKRGCKVVYQPLSEVVHYESYSYGKEREGTPEQSRRTAHQQTNTAKFYEKWKEVLSSEHFANGEKVFWARDRSFGRKTILVVDHYVPHYDKDAGSRTTFQLLQLFTDLNYNVKFIGDNFYKTEPYTGMLQQMGIEVLYGPWYRDNWQHWVIENKEMLDYVYLNRPHISIKYIDFFRSRAQAKLVYYGHDLHFIREQKQYEVEGNPALLESAERWKRTEKHIFENVDVILTLSLKEKAIIQSEFLVKEVRTMPAFFYSDFKPAVTDFSGRKDILFVGGFAHKPNVDAVSWFVREVWPLVNDPDMNFIVVGSHVPQEITALASKNIHIRGFVSDEELESIYASARLVVIPLRYGAGVKGKTVEAMYHGIPVVSTSFGIEGLKNIETVIRPDDTAQAFAGSIRQLYHAEDRLAAMSAQEVQYTMDNFSRSSVKNLMKEIFND